MYMDDRTNSTKSFKVSSEGTWKAKWYNDNLIIPVTVEYDIKATKTLGLDWTFLLILSIAIIICVSRVFRLR
jgi:hypothetical protein